MKEPDKEMMAYLNDKWGPFSVVLQRHTDGGKFRCDLCGEQFEKLAICTSQKQVDKIAYVCMGLCGQKFLGKKVMAKLSLPVEGLVNADPTAVEFAKEEIAAEEAMGIVDAKGGRMAPGNVAAAVKRAKQFRTAGFGKNWRVIPSIISQFDRDGRLSKKQVDTIHKFCHSCEREVGDGE